MKIFTFKQSIKQGALILALSLPMMALADEPAQDSSVQSGNSILGNIQKDTDSMNTNVTNIWNKMNGDFSNKDVAWAIVNAAAAERLNAINYNNQLLLMGAPYGSYAIAAGQLLGASTNAQALSLANANFLGMAGCPGNTSGPLGSVCYKFAGPTTLYNQILPFFTQGTNSILVPLNPAFFIQSDNLTAAGITNDQSQLLLNLLTTPAVPPAVALALAKTALPPNLPGGPTGADQESIVNYFIENMIMSVSTSALSDMIARRTPGTGSNGQPLPESVMQKMDEFSKSRFSDPAWYSEIGAASDTALLREIAHMQAYSTWVQYQQFRIQEQQMALLATMNVILGKMNVGLDQLSAQMASAAAQAQASANQVSTQIQNQQNNNSSGN